jgi:hypothetical protein
MLTLAFSFDGQVKRRKENRAKERGVKGETGRGQSQNRSLGKAA